MNRFCSILVTLALAVVGCLAQSPDQQRGFSSYSTIGATHDDSQTTMELNNSITYAVSRYFTASAGVPLYYVNASAPSTTTTTTTTDESYTAIGDFGFGIGINPHFKALTYKMSATGTAPTGNTDHGISPGSATWNWNNRLEKDLGRITPLVEAGLSNALFSTRQVSRPYNVLGGHTNLKAGVSLDIWKTISFEASGYDSIANGNQKIFSHIVSSGGSARGSGGHNRVYELNAVTKGGASLGGDRGYIGDLSADLTPRIDVDLAYSRSIQFATNSVSATVGFRLQHRSGDHKKLN